MRYPTLEYEISNFAGGLNLSVDESLLNKNESGNAENISIDNGILERTRGYKCLFEKSGITKIMPFTDMLVVCIGKALYKLTPGGNLTLIKDGYKADTWDYVRYNLNDKDVIIMTNGVDPIQVYDGTTIRDLKMNGKDSVEGAKNKAPKGKYLEVNYERLFVLSDEYLYISKDFDFDDFTTPVDENGEKTNQHGAYISNYTTDSSRAVGMKVVLDEVVIFKQDSIYKITGTTPTTYQRVLVTSIMGCIGDTTIANTNKGAYFLTLDGIYLYDGVNVKLVSDKVSKIFANKRLPLFNLSSIFYKNKYLLAYKSERNQNGIENDMLLEYDVNTNTFTLLSGVSIGEMVLAKHISVDYITFFNNNGVYIYNGAKFGNNLINAFWETPYSNLGVPNAIKEIGDCYITCSGVGTGKIKVSCITEKKTKSKIVNLPSQEKVVRVNLNSKGRLVKFRFENVDGSDFRIKNFKTIIDLDED